MEVELLSILISTFDEVCTRRKRVPAQVRNLSFGTFQGALKFDRVYVPAWGHCGPLY